ncbi:kinase [Novosphingobium olei]|uniref:Kinase n=1 Tax=Novosphingobium olei TaxID=2728851 RepID=A0A7Y0BMX8_9SPHN|nr:kinase [Novosphingobium olei]
MTGPLSALDIVDAELAKLLPSHEGRLLVIGLSGAQGSGKSTLATALAARLDARGCATAILSLDDLYRTKAERRILAETVHPLLATRGVPGTHDIKLGLDVIAALQGGEAAALPRFDKGADDRLPETQWPRASRDTRALILEGWCLGARPQGAAGLSRPINRLEAEEDPDGRWRGHADAALAGDYATLFARIDFLVMLRAPGFDIVARWRGEQEEPLRQAGRGMDSVALARFIAHYERITRALLDDLPDRADLVIDLDEDRSVLDVRRNACARAFEEERLPPPPG